MQHSTRTGGNSPGRKAGVLLIDDEPANLLALRAILEELGLDLVEARSGEEALARLAGADFAVVLLDVQLRGLDGFETARRIRGREESRHTPIIFLTAYETSRPQLEEAYALGAVDYLVKPLVPVILRAKVSGFVELFEKTEQVKRQADELRRMEQRQKEETLALLDTLQQNAPLGFAFVDREFRYVRINEALAAMDGRPAAELVGRTVQESVPQLWPRLEPLYRGVLESGQPVTNLEVTGETPAAPGKTRHWLANYYPVRVHGDIVGLGILVADITDRKRMEDELRQRAEQLTEADRRKDEFLAMLAHELRNPLTPIRNALHIMKEPAADAGAIRQARAMAERQVRHMARLLDDLLDVSRISRGRIELRKEVVDVAAVIHRAVEATRPLVDERRHELTVSLPAGALRVEADPTRLEQVLANLLNNAAKYTDPDGHIWLTASLGDDKVTGGQGGKVTEDSPPSVHRVTVSPCSLVRISVRDNGVGISPEMLSRIFDLFVQGERRLDRSPGGVGIGLTLVKKLVELHGGWVEASSAGPGRGSEFAVRLPALPAAPPGNPAQVAETAHAAELPRHRILVVDDNEDAANSLALLLRLMGQEVEVVLDGQAALHRARELRPQLVLLDLGMPGMDGYEVARRLRGDPGLRDSVLVALTGWGQEEDKRRSQAAGFDRHLVKPPEPDAVRAVLADLNVRFSPQRHRDTEKTQSR
jgi:PAS domain S-box-containing protein